MTGSCCSTILARFSISAALSAVSRFSARASSSSDLTASSPSFLYRSSLSLYFCRHSSRNLLIWSPPSGACVGSGPESSALALLASRPGPRRQPSLLIASVLALGDRSFRIRVNMVRSFRTCHLARPLNPITFLPNSSVSSKDGAEGVKFASVSDEDGFAKPESALLESDSSESEEAEEEAESLESEVSGPLLLASMSNGLESSDSASDESESSDSVSEDSDSDDSEPFGSASGGSDLSDLASESSGSSSGSGERGSQDSKQSVSLSLSEEPGENSEPPSGASAGAEPPSGPHALPGSLPQSSLTRLGPFL
jgi:hypothetical protein